MTTTDELLREWAAAGEHEVTLPTGRRVKVRLPTAQELLRSDSLPKDLRAAVLRFYTIGLDTRNVDDARVETIRNMQTLLAARSVRALWNEADQSWVPLQLEPALLRDLGLPEEDMTALEQMALRRKSPQQVNAESAALAVNGKLDGLMKTIDKEADATVNGWRPFRHERGSDPAGPDGAAVREVAGAGLPTD